MGDQIRLFDWKRSTFFIGAWATSNAISPRRLPMPSSVFDDKPKLPCIGSIHPLDHQQSRCAHGLVTRKTSGLAPPVPVPHRGRAHCVDRAAILAGIYRLAGGSEFTQQSREGPAFHPCPGRQWARFCQEMGIRVGVILLPLCGPAALHGQGLVLCRHFQTLRPGRSGWERRRAERCACAWCLGFLGLNRDADDSFCFVGFPIALSNQ